MQNVLIQGASRGIGLAIVRELLSRSDVQTVFASSREPMESEGLSAVADEFGERLVRLQMDVTEPHAVKAAADKVSAQIERLHLVFNVSGLLHDGDEGPEKKLGDLKADWLRRSFDVHAVGPALVAQHFFSLLRHDERAVLANMSARVGSVSDNRKGGWYAYRMTKAAQNMLTKTLAIELARKAPKLICAALHPGTVDTDLSKPFQRYVAHEVFAPERAAEQLLGVIDGLTSEQTGGFFAWDGSPIPW